MALITFKQAEALATRGRPWTFKMQFQGLDPNNLSGWSDKFWLATGRAKDEPVEIHFGATGSAGQIQVKDWAYVAAKVPEKEAKGYRFVDTPFVRVRQATIDAHNASKGRQAPVAITGTGPFWAPAPTPAAPAPVPAQPFAPPPPVGYYPDPAAKDPYDRIATVGPDPAAGNWKALDVNGKLVMRLTASGARTLLQENPAIKVAGISG